MRPRGGWRALGSLAGAAAIIVWLVPTGYAVYLSLVVHTFSATGTTTTSFSLTHYGTVIGEPGLVRYYLNSAAIAVPVVLVVCGCALGAAYSISRFRFPGRGAAYAALLLGLMIPGTALAVPAFVEMHAAGLINTYASVILVEAAVGMPFGLVVLKNFFDAFPHELEEAAEIDGAGALRVLVSVVVPNTRSALTIVAIWTLLNSWNDFLFQLLFLTRPSLTTVALSPLIFEGAHSAQTGDLFALLVLVSLPIVFVYVLAQRHLEAGLAGGGLKL